LDWNILHAFEREIGSLQVHTRYLTFSLRKTAITISSQHLPS